MKKLLLTLLTVVMAVGSVWAYTLPTSTMDLKTITAKTMGTWQDEKSYDLSDDWLVVSGYASYKSVGTGKQTWITQSSAGNSSSTWSVLENEPFKGSSFYTTASYTTIQKDRNLVYRVKNCKSVKVYGKNNSSSKYLQINIYEVTDGTAATSAAYTLSNTSTDEQVWSQTLDGTKEYVIDIEGVGTSNSRVFEVAFERNVVADTRKEPQLSLSATEFEAHVGDAEFAEPTVSSAGGYKGSYTYSSDKPAVASVNATTGEVTIGSSPGVATITVSIPEDDENYKPRSVSYTITVKKVIPVGATFYESFDLFDGDGGNDGIWSNITTTKALGTFDNEGWTTEGTNYSGNQCVSLRKVDASTVSGLTTPAIGVAGNGKVQFDAESWGTDGSNFFVDIVGGGTFVADDNLAASNISNDGTTAKVAMLKTGTWTTFELQFTGLTADSKFRFYAPANKRAFLDEVAVFVTPATATITLNAACHDEDGFVYGTYSNEKAFVVPADFIVYEIMVIDGAIMKEAYDEGDVVPANTGVLVCAEEGGDYTVTLSNEAGESVLGEDNALRPSGAGITNKEMEEDGDNYYYRLTMQNGTKIGFWWGAENGAAFDLGANKAYLVAPKSSNAKGFSLDDDITLIEAINASEKANGVAYNLAGQRVNANHKGIVIINGNKFINK